MKKFLAFLLLSVFLAAHSEGAGYLRTLTRKFASASGTADCAAHGASSGDPCTLAAFFTWLAANPALAPNSQLWLAAGVYQGANNMIAPSSGIAGKAGG